MAEKELSIIEKATELNRLRCLKWTGTPKEPKATIDKMFQGYNKDTNMIIDSYMWNVYGLHYKEYLDTSISFLCTYCPIKLEKAIDKSIEYLKKELNIS